MFKKRVCLAALLILGLAVGSASADVTAGLVGHWPFDGDVTDASGNGNDGTISGNAALASDRFGTPNGAMFFSGESDSYVDVGDPPEFQISGAMTLTAWVFLNGANVNNSRIVAKQAGGGSRSWNLNIEAESGGVANPATFQISETGDTILGLVDTQPLPTDQWVHMAGVYQPGEAMELYVDGQLHARNTSGIPASQFSDNGMPVLIGSRSGCGNCGWDGNIDDVRIYARALSAAEIRDVVRGDSNLSSNPEPADEATDVPRETVMSWAAGEFAAAHDVYFGTAFDDVNDGGRADATGMLASEGQTSEAYDPPALLDYGQTYYWRVDEVNTAPDNTIFKGNVWSFTTEPVAYPIANVTANASGAQANAGPEKTIDGSGLDDDQHSVGASDMWLTAGDGAPVWIQYEFDRIYKLHEMWVWNYNVQFELMLGFGLKDVAIEYSEDGENWMSFGDVAFAQGTARADYAPNTTVDLDGVAAKYVRLNVNSAWSAAGQFGLSEVRFLYIPVHAREPQPADGAATVDPDTVLSWRSGRDAASHDVYLGDDSESLRLVGSISEISFTPDDLLYGRTYYWRIDEVNDADAPFVWTGDLWNFTVQEFMTIEDFESYDDEDNLIYETWIDGWVNETGSTVGYLEAPFAETSIVHGGRQSMPLEYINTAAPYHSEAERDLGDVDWTAGGADTLRLYVQGRADNDPGTLYVAVEDSAGTVAVVSYPDQAVVTTEAWQEWTIRLADLSGVNLAAVRTVYIGVGDRNNPTAGGTGLIFIDDIAFGHPAGE
jgi:Concanavalin A-like lectin/glucanases superfamily/F5/8 type C domain